ncbi:voltage-gated potassium channel [Neoconidiobolus thromboides FSU 785]|nr:voltage-gated potassium channel [Neoconidiobolus thromboides FSU 785]
MLNKFKNKKAHDNKENQEIKHPEVRYLPTLVGIITPLSLILTIPPLRGNWVNTENLSVDYYHDFKADVACLSLAFIFQVIGTIALLFRFWEKKIRINTLLTIIFLTLHASIVIYYERWQMYYYKLILNLIGISISAISILLLIIDYFKSNYLINKNSGIVNKQRMLIIYFILNTVWGKIGTIIFCILEDWEFVDGLYFVLLTNATIGFGDITPNNRSSQLFLFFYAFIGIIFMGLFINSIRIVLLGEIENKFLKKLKEVEKSTKERINESENESDENESDESENAMKNNQNSSDNAIGSSQNDNINTRIKNQTESGVVNLLNFNFDYKNASSIRKKQRELAHKEKSAIIRRQFFFAVIYLLLFWFLGGVIFMYSEDWSYFDAINFCFISFTTIGYGNITPTTFHGKIIFIGYAILGLVAATYLISVGTQLGAFTMHRKIENVHADYKMELHHNRFNHKRKQLIKEFEREIVTDYDSTTNGDNKDELICNLVAMSKIYQKLVANLIADHDSVLTKEITDKKEFVYLEEYHYLYCHLLNQTSKKMELNKKRRLKKSENKIISKLDFDFMDDTLHSNDNNPESGYMDQADNDLVP